MLDVLVIGGGHAGLEAAAAASRLGARAGLVTLHRDAVGRLSCNPAIGGVGKGHLVREIHVLGGLMGRLADECGIQFRLLNTSRGPAVRGPRAQVDRREYPRRAQAELAGLAVEVLEDEIVDLLVESGEGGRKRCRGAVGRRHGPLEARATLLSTGTFLGGVLHVGDASEAGGRRGEGAAAELSSRLRDLGLTLGRFKTGTPPRLARDSVDWDLTQVQPGDAEPVFFCPETVSPVLRQVPCHAVYTNPAAHAAVRDGLARSPLMAGRIVGTGPRYCPSFEEKILRFADRDRHLLVLEPEGLDHPEIYVNGASTSLPEENQRAFVRAIPALRDADITQLGHAVEYDYLAAGQVLASLETRAVAGLFVAGQTLGTTGYEEAAGLGLMAGANAALVGRGEAPFVLGRHEGYLGVLVDDLVTRGIDEPYRMFTSRAEHRLLLGVDTADLRLAERGAAVGLVAAAAASAAANRRERLELATQALRTTPAAGGRRLADACRRPEADLEAIAESLPAELLERLGASPRERRRTVVQAGQSLRYECYVRRQQQAAERLERARSRPIPPEFSFEGLAGLSREVQERLSRARPTTLDQAARLRGVTPAAAQLLDAHLTRWESARVPRGTSP